MATTFTPEELTSFKQNYDVMRAQKAQPKPLKQQPKKKPGGVAGLLQGLMPIAGGALGAIAGVPLGPAGIIAGGAAGSAGGEALKQKLQGGPIDRGNIVEQAAFGAIPGVGKGIKALRAGGSAASLLGRGVEKQAVEQAATDVVRPNMATKVYNKGVITEARSGGFGQGEKITGGTTQGFRDAERNSKVLQDEGIRGGSASSRQIAAGDRLAQHAKTIDTAVEAKNPKVLSRQKADIISRVQTKITGGPNGTGIPGYIPGDNANSKFAISLANQFSTIKDAKGLLAFKRALDEQAINYGRNSSAPDPIKEQIAKAFRKEVNDEFGKLVPEAKAASKSYSKLHDANEFLKQGGKDLSDSSTKAAGGIIGRVLTSDTAGALKSKGGRGMQTLGKALGAKTGTAEQAVTQAVPPRSTASQLLNDLTSARTVGGAGVQQALPRAVGASLGVGAQSELPPEQAAPTEDQMASMFVDGNTPIPEATATAPESPYSQESMLSDIQRDPKHADTYLSLYKQLNPEGDTKKGLNSTASGVIADTKTGLAALQQLSGKIEGSNANNPGIGQLRGMNPFDTNAQSLKADINTARQIVGKALEGGVLRKEDEVKYKSILPTNGDTDQVAQYKIKELINLISGRLNEYQSNISGGTGGGEVDTSGLVQ